MLVVLNSRQAFGVILMKITFDARDPYLICFCVHPLRRYRNQPTTPGGGVLAVDAHTGTVLWNITCAGGVPLFVEEHDAV